MGFAWALPWQSVDGSYDSIAHAIFGDWQLNGVIAAFTGSPFTDGRQRHRAEHAVEHARRPIRSGITTSSATSATRASGSIPPSFVAADRRPLRQHGPEPVLRSWRVDDGPVDLPLLRYGRPAPSRSARAGQQHLQPPRVRQPERDARRPARSDRSPPSGRVAGPTSSGSSRSASASRSNVDDPRRACERGGDSPRAPSVRRPMSLPAGPILLLAIARGCSRRRSHRRCRPLPRLALDTFPAAARDAVSTQYKEAAARPADAAASGALGRMLHAWEQWDSAHQAYERAAALAPSDFDWSYLDAVVLQRLARYDAAAQRSAPRACRADRTICRPDSGWRKCCSRPATSRRANSCSSR